MIDSPEAVLATLVNNPFFARVSVNDKSGDGIDLLYRSYTPMLTKLSHQGSAQLELWTSALLDWRIRNE